MTPGRWWRHRWTARSRSGTWPPVWPAACPPWVVFITSCCEPAATGSTWRPIRAGDRRASWLMWRLAKWWRHLPPVMADLSTMPRLLWTPRDLSPSTLDIADNTRSVIIIQVVPTSTHTTVPHRTKINSYRWNKTRVRTVGYVEHIWLMIRVRAMIWSPRKGVKFPWIKIFAQNLLQISNRTVRRCPPDQKQNRKLIRMTSSAEHQKQNMGRFQLLYEIF